MAKIKPPSSRLGRALAAALPPTYQSRARPVAVMVRLSEAEAELLRHAAEQRGEPLATTVRALAVTAAGLLTGADTLPGT